MKFCPGIFLIFLHVCFIASQAKINHEILNSKVFSLDNQYNKKAPGNKLKSSSASSKARMLMNLHNNEAGRRVSLMNQIILLFYVSKMCAPLHC